MRIFSSILCLTLAAGCSAGGGGNGADDALNDMQSGIESVSMAVPCAIGGEAEAVCTLQSGDNGDFTVAQADGGFRRFSIDRDGVILAADGAEAARSAALSQGAVRIEVGADQYRLSAEQLRAIQPQ